MWVWMSPRAYSLLFPIFADLCHHRLIIQVSCNKKQLKFKNILVKTTTITTTTTTNNNNNNNDTMMTTTTTALFQSARMLRRILKTWGDLMSLRLTSV